MASRKSAAQIVPQSAVALVRISDDPDGRAVGVGRQEEDCRALAERLGWVIAEVIVENDTSAYSTRQKLDDDGLPTRVTKRPEFRRALKQLHSGRNDGLIVYDIDRLARQPRDLEALIDLAEVRNTPVQAVTGSLDVSTSAGRAMARVLMAMANKSSEDTGRRVARAARQRAELGMAKTDGFLPYGYDRTMTIVPLEAAVIREVAERILLGDTVRSIATDLNARGIPAARGGLWRNPAVKSVVSKPTVAGLRAYDGDVVAEGSWEPILDRDTWEMVRARLALARTGVPTGSDRYLLSGVARCGPCGAKLYVGTARQGKVYRCNECHKVTRSLPWLDEQVVGVVEELLGRDEITRARSRRGAKRPHRAAVERATLEDRRRQILDSAADFGPADVRRMLDVVDERLAELEVEAAGTFGGLVLPRAADFGALPLGRKRAVVNALVRVEVLPSDGKALDPESVRITPAY